MCIPPAGVLYKRRIVKISDPFLKSFKSIEFTVKQHWRFHYTLNERDFFYFRRILIKIL